MAKSIVRENIIVDGIGGQAYRKLLAMCFAKENNLLFENIPFFDIMIHPSDKINTDWDKGHLIKTFNSFIKDEWKDINFDKKDYLKIVQQDFNSSDKFIDQDGGFWYLTDLGKSYGPELINHETNTKEVATFHIRRSNAMPGNPRYISDEDYVEIIKVVLNSYGSGLKPVIITDSIGVDKFYPITKQKDYWHQTFLNENNDGSYNLSSINKEFFVKKFPNIEIIDSLSPLDSVKYMLNSKILVTFVSAFGHIAGLTTSNKTISYQHKRGYKNEISYWDLQNKCLIDTNKIK
jgi:hypothetical protein